VVNIRGSGASLLIGPFQRGKTHNTGFSTRSSSQTSAGHITQDFTETDGSQTAGKTMQTKSTNTLVYI